jgi:hypothetical protein
MARQPALNEEALVKLGSEKLARLVIGEAKRNAAFRKLVAAALAATKGPAAVAAIIDKRLAGLDRAKAFVDWEKAKAFTADITATLATITGELASANPDAAVDRLVRFSRPPNECSSGSTIRMAPCRTSIMRQPLLSRILSGGSSKLIRLRSRIGFSL